MTHKPHFTKSQGGGPGAQESDSESRRLSRLITDFLEELEISGRATITARRYHDYLVAFADWLARTTGREIGALSIADIDEERLRQYRLYLARRRDARTGDLVAPATRNLYQIAVRNLLRYCQQRHLPVPDPTGSLPLARERDLEIRHLERDEVARMADAIPLDQRTGLRDRAILETLFGTGMRLSELVALKIRQVNLDTRETEVVGKGGKSRLVLLTTAAAGWLRRYLQSREDDSPYVFVSNRRDAKGLLRSLTGRQVQRVIDLAARRAGLPFRISPHWLRHSRLTLLSRYSGVEVAQRIAGHASLNTTARYLHASNPHLKRAFDEAEEAARA
jgi:integrase/recombinase XerD